MTRRRATMNIFMLAEDMRGSPRSSRRSPGATGAGCLRASPENLGQYVVKDFLAPHAGRRQAAAEACVPQAPNAGAGRHGFAHVLPIFVPVADLAAGGGQYVVTCVRQNEQRRPCPGEPADVRNLGGNMSSGHWIDQAGRRTGRRP